MNFGFVIDNRKCIGCHACTVACKSEHNVPIGVNRTWVKYIEKGEFPNTRRLFSVMRCNHCENAPCVSICPVTALYSRADGIVDFDNRRCIGCKSCMQACPYDALFIDPDTNTAAKCNYCAHRIDIGLEPACVIICPEEAIVSGDLDDPASRLSLLLAQEQVTARKVEKGTQPKLFYIEGDEALLKPIVTAAPDSTLWSAQTSGVGHFAKYAAERISQADAQEMAKMLAAGKLHMAANGSNGSVDEATQALAEKARLVYDAPGKGRLWGNEVSAYVWAKAISAGAFLVPFIAVVSGLTPVSELVQWAGLGLSLVFLALTNIFLVMDLDQPGRFAYVLLRPQWGSWLTRGGYIITLFAALLVLLAVTKFFGWNEVESKLLWLNASMAILTAVYTAFLFAQAKGRDFWQSPMLAIHMLVHALLAGAAAFSVFSFIAGSDAMWDWFLQNVLYFGLAANLVVLFLEMTITHPTADAQKTVQIILSGHFKIAFWVGTLLVGNVLPLLLLWQGSVAMLGLAGALVLAGIFITEHIWVQAPQRLQLS